jgi:hypothetical protein
MRTAFISLIVLGWAAVARGQQTFPEAPPVLYPPTLNLSSPPPAVVPSPLSPSASTPGSYSNQPVTAGPPATVAETVLSKTAVGQEHTLGVQVQFGEPTGVRVQYAFFPQGEFTLLLEGFAGSRDHDQFWGHESVFGAGLRGQFTLLSDGSKNALLVGPGVGASFWEGHERPTLLTDQYGDLYVGQRRDDRYYLNLDTNVSWVHELSGGLAWELGVNLGFRVGLHGQDHDGRNIYGRIGGGLVGVYTGLRY